MDTQPLAAGVAGQDEARAVDGKNSRQFVEVEKQKGPAATRVDASKAKLTLLRGKALLGEATAAEVAAEEAEYNAATTALAAILSAIEVVRPRCEASGQAVREANDRAAAEARHVASTWLEPDRRSKLHAATEAFAEAFVEWNDVAAVAHGGYLTGGLQQDKSGVISILEERGIRGAEYLQTGHPEGRQKLLEPRAILARAKELAGK